MHILMITRHFPPEISGGARRPSLYTQALRAQGHRVTLVTPFHLDDEDSITVNNSAIDNAQKAVLKPQQNAAPPSYVNRLRNMARIWAYWPDENVKWVRAVIKAVKRYNLQPDWIMTTSPPESIHLAGAALSKHFRAPWLAELRDTWIVDPHRKVLSRSKFRARVETLIAKRTLRHARAITAVSEAVMAEGELYTRYDTPKLIVSHFSDPPPAPLTFNSKTLNLFHAGGFTLSDHRRLLAPLLQQMARLHAQRPNLVFHIAGPLSPDEIKQSKEASVPVKWHGCVSLETSCALQAGADGLVLYTPEVSHALPGKYAEYALAGRPILFMGGGEWLSLVKDRATLRPLYEGGLALRKNERVAPAHSLTSAEAAERLIKFLQRSDGPGA